MNRFVKILLTVICLTLIVGNLIACNVSGVTLLSKAASAERLSYSERNDEGLDMILSSANGFASSFSAEAYKDYDGGANFAVAPISVYMALSIAAQCASQDTRSEVLAALGITYDQLQSNFSVLYRSLIAEYTTNTGAVAGRVQLSNSIWIDKSATVKSDCINTLADKFYCYSYSADFAGDNKGANREIRKFVKEQTHNLIDRDFNLSEDTLFTLINTLYLKDVWNDTGKDLPFAVGQYSFVESDGNVKSTSLLQGYYERGRVVETDSYTHFYVSTEHGYKVKFILPKDGYTVDDVFTAENIATVNSIADYNADDEENMIHYYTRCLFPEFGASYDKDVKDILQRSFGINALFEDCNFSTLTNNNVYCGGVKHVTELKVNKKGIEGAAVTVLPMVGEAGPDGWETVYYDYVVDRAFAFVITDRYDTTIFSGVIGNI